MAKAPAEQPKIPNDRRPAFQKRLAIHILLQEAKEKLNARIKANNKAAEQEGFDPKKIKTTFDLSKKSPSEIAKHYAAEFEMLDHQGINLSAQFNLFGGADIATPKKGPDLYHAGLTAGIHGKDGVAPKNFAQDQQQRWLEGWNDGQAARVIGGEHLAQIEADLKAADAGGPAPKPASDQTDLEEAVDASKMITIKLSDFGPNAVLDDMEIEDLDLELSVIEGAEEIVIVAEDGRRNVLKSRDGETGVFDASDDFEASEEELAAQKARPSSQAATDPGEG